MSSVPTPTRIRAATAGVIRSPVLSKNTAFVVGSLDDWDQVNRKKALRTVSKGTLELAPAVEDRLTPYEVQKLAYVTGRSGKRVKTPNFDNDPYWRELRAKAKLLIPTDATHFFTKHFDTEYAQYFYYDHVSCCSTWDRPAGDNIEVHRPESLINTMFESSYNAAVEKKKLVERRRIAYDVIQKEKAERLAAVWLEDEKAAAKQLQNIWRNACMEASLYGGRFELNWINLGHVDPFMYRFEEEFGLPLKSMKLVGLSLDVLTDDVCRNMNSLETLSLACNNLTHLPDNIVLLTKLQKLNILRNKIVELPKRIGSLSNSLCRLEVANNLITSLPMTFGALHLMTVINIECNKLKVLPENLDQLVSCKYFNVSNNCLVRIPRCIARMPNLVTFSACKNQIAYIPNELTESTSLRAIRLSSNLIRHVPDGIGNMKRLKELCLDHNLLALLPLSMHLMIRLRVLRIDGNVLLTDPPIEVVAKGAEGVVEYFKERVMRDEGWKIRTIVTAVQDVLTQAVERNIYDEAEFQGSTKIEDDPDEWFAFQLPYFWSQLIPALQDVWKMEGMMGNRDLEKKFKVVSFPYGEREVNWALGRMYDVNGPILKFESVKFRKCACTDEEGNRKPCVPPEVGWMCKRQATLVKCKNVMEADRQNRIWEAYSKSNLSDAINRAKSEASDYLNSVEGKDWLASMAIERADELMGDREESTALKWRQKLADKRKKKIIQKFDRKKSRIAKIRDLRVAQLNEDIERMKEEDERMKLDPELRDGFLRKRTQAMIETAEHQLLNIEQDVQLERLQLMCEHACDAVDDDVYEQHLKSDEIDPLASSSSESDSDSSVEEKERKKHAKKKDSDDEDTKSSKSKDPRAERVQERLKERAAKRAQTAEEIEVNAKRVRSYQKVNAPDGTLVPPSPRGCFGTVPPASELEHMAENFAEDMADNAVTQANAKLNPKSGAANNISNSKQIRKKHGAMRRSLRHIKDVVEIRSRRMYSDWTGENVELLRELTYEYHQQYTIYMVSIAKGKALHDLQLIDSMRRSLGAAGMVVVFEAWREYVTSKRLRERKDLEETYKNELKAFSTAMESVKIAEVHVSRWQKRVDVYTDQVFYENEETKAIALALPTIQNYLPSNFVVPPMPTALPPWEKDGKSENKEEDKGRAVGDPGGGGGDVGGGGGAGVTEGGVQENNVGGGNGIVHDVVVAPQAPTPVLTPGQQAELVRRQADAIAYAAAERVANAADGPQRVRFGLLDIGSLPETHILGTFVGPEKSLSFQLIDDSYSDGSSDSDDDYSDGEDDDDDEFASLGLQMVEEEGSGSLSKLGDSFIVGGGVDNSGRGNRSNNHGTSALSFNSTRQVMASSLRVDESGLGFGLPIGFGQNRGGGGDADESPRAKAHRRASIDALNDTNDTDEPHKDNNKDNDSYSPSSMVDARADLEASESSISVRAVSGGGGAQQHPQHRPHQHRLLSKKQSSMTVGFDLESSALDLLHGQGPDSPGGGGGRGSPRAGALRNPLRKNYGSEGTMFGSSVFGSSGNFTNMSPLSETLSPQKLFRSPSSHRRNSKKNMRRMLSRGGGMTRGGSERRLGYENGNRKSGRRSARSFKYSEKSGLDEGEKVTDEMAEFREQAVTTNVAGAASQFIYSATKGIVPYGATHPILLNDAAAAAASNATTTPRDITQRPGSSALPSSSQGVNPTATANPTILDDTNLINDDVTSTQSPQPLPIPTIAALTKPLRGVRGRIARALLREVDITGGALAPSVVRNTSALTTPTGPGVGVGAGTITTPGTGAHPSSSTAVGGVVTVHHGEGKEAGKGVVSSVRIPSATNRPSGGGGAAGGMGGVVGSVSGGGGGNIIPTRTIAPTTGVGTTTRAISSGGVSRHISIITKSELKQMHKDSAVFYGITGTEAEQFKIYEDEKDIQAIAFKQRATEELYIAEKRVRQMRALKAKGRKEIYLPAPKDVSKALQVVLDVENKALIEVQYAEEVAAKKETLKARSNRFGYDISNFQRLPEGHQHDGLQEGVNEHLLYLASEDLGEKENIQHLVRSDRANNLRTNLAYEAMKINKELTQLAVREGMIPPPKPQSFYERNFKPLFDPKYSSESSSSDEIESTGDKKADERARKILEKQKMRELKELRAKKRAEDAAAKEKLDLAIYKALRNI